MNFRLTEGNTDAQNGTTPIRPDAHRNQDGTAPDFTINTHFDIGRIQQEKADSSKRPGSPFFKFIVKHACAAADLCARDLKTAELLQNLGHFAGRYPLNIHLRQGNFQRSFASQSFVQGAGIKIHSLSPDLRHG